MSSNQQSPTPFPQAGECADLLKAGLFPLQTNFCHCDLFQELHSFRKKVEEGRSGLHHHPYTANKNRVIIYKTIFFALALIFIIFAYYLYASSFCWTCTLLFGDNSKVRLVACSTCALFAAASLVLGLLTKPQDEIIHEVVRRAKKRAKIIFNRRMSAERVVNNSTPYGPSGKGIKLRHAFEDLKERIKHFKEEASLTMKRIEISRNLDESQKEFLYNQAILELQYKLEVLIRYYEENRLVCD